MLSLPDVALTVRQPWAWAIAEGLKLLEIRSKPPPKKWIGHRIALHAAKPQATNRDIEQVEIIVHRMALRRDVAPFETSAIIATFTLEGFVNAQGAKTLPRDLYRWWNPKYGAYGWILRDVVKFETVLPASGQLGFWKLKPELRSAVIAEQVLAQPKAQLTTMRDAARAAGFLP